MPDRRTEISELVTGLGMLEYPSVAAALDARPAVLRNVADASWFRVREARSDGVLPELFDAAWENGRAFLHARDGLRGRPPLQVEWKGPSRPVGYEAVPADLRVDHVFLISCKHASRILHNVAPSHLFERGLAARRGDEASVDWFAATAPEEYQALYEAAAPASGVTTLPARAVSLDSRQRRALSLALRETKAWPQPAAGPYADLCRAVASVSAERWNAALASEAAREEQLWRLLRLSSAPYFVLGASAAEPVRLRIATPWDWRQAYEFNGLDIRPDPFAKQPLVRWAAAVRRRSDDATVRVEGFVEIRWSHGRFGGHPEAKVQLVTPHHEVPGYEPLV